MASGQPSRRAAAKRILLVEDDAWIALDEQQLLISAGFDVIGPMPSVASALESIERQMPDGAVLDVTLSDAMMFPIADALTRAGVPFVIVTGHSKEILPPHYRDRPRVTKPYTAKGLLDAVRGAFCPHAQATTG